MWKPTEIGEIIARRTLTLERGDEIRQVVLDVGRPVRAPNREPNDPWWCVAELDGLESTKKRYVIAGEDALQALLLLLEFLEKTLPHIVESEGAKLYWLGAELGIVFGGRR